LLYYACKNLGSWKKKIYSLDDIKNLKNNSLKIQCSKNTKNKKIILLSKSNKISKELDEWLMQFKDFDLVYMGSSKKFCFLAEGAADYYCRFKPCSEWDTAAGDIILTEANGILKDVFGNKITYNTKENLINPYFIAKSI